MAQDTTIPFPVGSQLSGPAATGVLGQVYRSGQRAFRYVKAGETILKDAVLVTQFSAGQPTWTVVSTVTANDPTVAGVVPLEYTTGITSGNYFLLQVAGYTTPAFAVTSLTNTSLGAALSTSTVPGCAAAFTAVSDPTALTALFGIATNTAGTTAATTTAGSSTMQLGRASLVGLVDKWGV